LIAAQDASFIRKSGKHTFGLDHFFNSCAARAERGLEISTLAVVNVTANCVYTLATAQTPPSEALLREDKEQTRIDFYVKQLHEHRHLLPADITYLAADGFYAKQKYVDGVRACHLHLIVKLCCDADLRFLYMGRREKRGGRPRRYDGKVDFADLSRFQYLGTVEEADHLHLYTAALYHVSLKRRLRVVVILDYRDPKKRRYAALSSTDTALGGKELYRLYRVRFQIEFIFRDAKQFTGLLDCQARDRQALDFHFNVALATLNVARAEAILALEGMQLGLYHINSLRSTHPLLIISMANRAGICSRHLPGKLVSGRLKADDPIASLEDLVCK
jgi:DDE superfamily endonuclease